MNIAIISLIVGSAGVLGWLYNLYFAKTDKRIKEVDIETKVNQMLAQQNDRLEKRVSKLEKQVNVLERFKSFALNAFAKAQCCEHLPKQGTCPIMDYIEKHDSVFDYIEQKDKDENNE